MKLLLKILAAPIILLLALAVAFGSFVLEVTGFFSWLLSALVFAGAVILFFSERATGGIAFMVIAFLVSPYGFPALATGLIGKLDGARYCLQELILE